MVAHTCNPSTQVAEAGKSQVEDQTHQVMKACVFKTKWSMGEMAQQETTC